MATFFPVTPRYFSQSDSSLHRSHSALVYPPLDLTPKLQTPTCIRQDNTTQSRPVTHIQSQPHQESCLFKICKIALSCFCLPCCRSRKKITHMPPSQVLDLETPLLSQPYIGDMLDISKKTSLPASNKSVSTTSLDSIEPMAESPQSSLDSRSSSPMSTYSAKQKITMWQSSPLRDIRLLDLESIELLIENNDQQDLIPLKEILSLPIHEDKRNSLSPKARSRLDTFNSDELDASIMKLLKSSKSVSSSKTPINQASVSSDCILN